MNVLVISNNESDLRWINNILIENGIDKSELCTNSADAIHLLPSGNFELILTEAFLPVLTGLDLKQLLDSFNYNIPVILFSEIINQNTEKEAKYAGIQKCITFDQMEEELPLEIEKVLATKSETV